MIYSHCPHILNDASFVDPSSPSICSQWTTENLRSILVKHNLMDFFSIIFFFVNFFIGLCFLLPAHISHASMLKKMCQRDRSATSTTWNNKVIVLIFFYKSRFFPSFLFFSHSFFLFIAAVAAVIYSFLTKSYLFKLTMPFIFSVCVYIFVCFFFFLRQILFISNVRWQLVVFMLWPLFNGVIGIPLLHGMRGLLRSINLKMFILTKSSCRKRINIRICQNIFCFNTHAHTDIFTICFDCINVIFFHATITHKKSNCFLYAPLIK